MNTKSSTDSIDNIDRIETPKLTQRIAFRYLSIVLAMLLILLAVFGVTLISRHFTSWEDELALKSQGQVNFLSAVSSEAILSRDFITLESLMRQTTADPDVVYAVVINADGRALTRYLDQNNEILSEVIASNSGNNDILALFDEASQNTLVREIRQPIVFEDQTLGEVRLGYSIDHAREQALIDGQITILSILLIVIVVSSLTTVVFRRLIGTPVSELSLFAQRLASGNLHQRVDDTRNDEIGNLGTSFNKMAIQLEKAFADIQENETRLVEAQRIAQMGNWDWDIANDNLKWSDETFRIVGTEPQAFSPSLATFTQYIHPEDREDVTQALNNAVKKDIPYDIEHRVLRDDGTIRIVQQRGEVTRNSDGRATRMIGTVNDITEQKEIEETLKQQAMELRKATAIAREANRLKSEFLATMSHELRTPLNAMIGFTEIMLGGMGGTLDEDAVHMTKRIHSNSQRLLALINDVLDMAKIEARRINVSFNPFSPETLANNLHSEMSSLAQKQGLEFNMSIDPDLPPEILGDEALIRRIVTNLLSNAFKFTEKGSVNMAMHNIGDEQWSIEVIDTGIGIPPHAREYIFEPFRQIDGSSQRAYGGTGLGLAITQELANTLDGHIRLESAVDEGSTFIVTLPLRVAKNENGQKMKQAVS